MSGDPELARSMRLCLVMLTHALPNVEVDAVTEEDRHVWACGLEHLARQLRGSGDHVVVPGEVQP